MVKLKIIKNKIKCQSFSQFPLKMFKSGAVIGPTGGSLRLQSSTYVKDNNFLVPSLINNLSFMVVANTANLHVTISTFQPLCRDIMQVFSSRLIKPTSEGRALDGISQIESCSL